MRIATRLTVVLMAAALTVVAAYIVVSNAQRRAMLRDDLAHRTEAMAEVLRLAGQDMAANGRAAALDSLLRSMLGASDVFAAVVLDPAGTVAAGGGDDLGCLRAALPALPVARPVEGRAGCGVGVSWTALPLAASGGTLVVALEEVLLERAVSAALQRQLLLALGLLLAITLAVSAILRRTLSGPLDRIMDGVLTLARTGSAPEIRVEPSAGELAHLARAVNDTAARLESKHQQLQQGMEERIALERRLKEAETFAMLGRLSGGLAHELGSPLSVIGMRAEVLAGAPGLPPHVRQHAHAITTEVGQVTEFIHGLLHMARQHGIVFEPVDLASLVRSLQDDLAARIEGARIDLEVELPPEPVVVLGQETLLRHALRNLLRNGYHALRGHAGERSIRVRLEPDLFEVRVLVEDSGPGIPAERMDQVFEPFFTTREPGAGSGLGLPVSRGIVEEHGGELWLENRPEGGVRAVLSLPLPPAPEEPTGTRTAAAPGAAHEQ